MTIQQRKLRFKSIYKNPLSEKLRAKKAESILKAQIKKSPMQDHINLICKTI
jgi:hypothetical protein